jgi:M6 family metalloprotease-like protein
MRRFLFLLLPCFISAQNLVQGYDPTQFTHKKFPISGEINAIFVFVQFDEDTFEHCALLMGYDENGKPQMQSVEYGANCQNRPSKRDKMTEGTYQSWTDDPISEWPSNLPKRNARTRQLPRWAKTVVDVPNSKTFTRGSLTEFYQQMSNGKFTVRGRVYPYTYIPEHPQQFYTEYYQHIRSRSTEPNPKSALKFPHGGVLLNHEILSYLGAHPENMELGRKSLWDRYNNGEGSKMQPDGKVDMIVLVFRFSGLRNMSPIPQDNVTSLGAFSYDENACSPDREPSYLSYDAFGCHPIRWGNLSVVDNLTGGSGVVITQQTRRNVVRTTAHEIGHRQFFFQHTESDNMDEAATDIMSVMNGNHEIGFSAWDRILLGWANVSEVNLNAIPEGRSRNFALENAAKVSRAPDVLWIRSKATKSEGDLLIEARFRTSSQECAPRTACNLDDGDAADYFLPNEGLYLYKAPPGDSYLASSLLAGGITRRKKGMGVLHVRQGGFKSGDVLSPFTEMPFQFWQSALDRKIALTNIQLNQSAKTIRFKIWNNAPAHFSKPNDPFYSQNRLRNMGRE